jgi:cell wall-associated NlpC family hydrolase
MSTRALLVLLGLALVLGLAGPPAVAGGIPAHMQRQQRIAKVLNVARSLEGTPYLWGGTNRHGFDCSGYTRFVFSKVGEHLPRTSSAQFAEARKIPKRNVRRGDLVFFTHHNGVVYHVGIYAGASEIWHAPHTGASVRLEQIWTNHWRAGRILTGNQKM